MAELAKRWEGLCVLPMAEEAWIVQTDDGLPTALVRVARSDPATGKKTSAVVAVVASGAGAHRPQQTPAFALGDDVAVCAPSPCGALFAVLRADPPKIDVVDRFGPRLSAVDASAKHGKILGPETFGSAAWSPDARHVAYIAEPLAPECRSFWETAEEREKAEKKQQQLRPAEEKFLWREDWGERLQDVCCPAIFVLDVAAGSIRRFSPRFNPDDEPLLASGAALGQVCWAKDGTQLVFTAWPTSPRRLGITYCTNRRASVFRVNFTANDSELATRCTPEDVFSAVCPRVSPSGNSLFVAWTDVSRFHSCAYNLGWVSPPSSEIHPASEGTTAVPNDGPVAPVQCFASENVVLVNTQMGFRRTPLILYLDSESCVKMPFPEGFSGGSGVVLAASHGTVVAVFSTPITVPTLAVGVFGSNGISWNVLGRLGHTEATTLGLQGLEWETCTIAPETRDPLFPRFPFEALLVRQKLPQMPLVVMLHGGPHSSNSSAFNPEAAFFLLAGYNVLHVNYTGSNCWGDEEIARLPGRIGELDVLDCEDAIRAVLEQHPQHLDPSRIVLFGGSHGGFLVGHLISRKQPDLVFAAASVRNPVFNLASMIDTSDIPDWCIEESGALGLSGKALVAALFERSPACRVSENGVSVPTAVFLGQSDRRVPNEQGKGLYRALCELGVPTVLRVYPGVGHAFVKPHHRGDCLVNSALWFSKHLPH